MRRAEYYVRPDRAGWIIARDGDEYGPYDSRHEAMFAAVDAAHKLTVRLIDAAGRPVAAWTYGTDPFPPVFFLDRQV